MFKLRRGQEDETKLTWLTAVALTGEGMMEFGEVKGGGPRLCLLLLPLTHNSGDGGLKVPTCCHKGTFLALFVSLEFISEEN